MVRAGIKGLEGDPRACWEDCVELVSGFGAGVVVLSVRTINVHCFVGADRNRQSGMLVLIELFLRPSTHISEM
ncbi:hypothetical protein D3C80_1849700 [compost metagenome]